MKKFEQDELNSLEEHEINSSIMEEASDIADELTELECKNAGIECWITEGNESSFTEEAQEIFDVHYDRLKESFYYLLNRQIEIINKYKK